MRHAPQLIALLALPALLLVNPLLLQGCFLRCPEPLPYDDGVEVQTTSEKLDQIITLMHDDGVLELQISRTSLTPALTRRPEPDQDHALHLVQTAHAIPSCQHSEPPPSAYTLNTRLVATWIPAEGEALTLIEDERLQPSRAVDAAQARSGRGELTLSGTGVRLDFEGRERYQLTQGSIHATVNERPWHIEFTADAITTLQRD